MFQKNPQGKKDGLTWSKALIRLKLIKLGEFTSLLISIFIQHLSTNSLQTIPYAMQKKSVTVIFAGNVGMQIFCMLLWHCTKGGGNKKLCF